MHLLAAQPGAIDDGEPVDLCQTPAELVVITAADTELAALSEARAAMDAPPTLRLASLMHLRHPMSVDLHLDACATHAKLVVARILGGRGYWPYGLEQYAARLHKAGVPFAALPGDDRPDPELRDLSTIAADDYDALWSCLVEGGPANATTFLAHARAMIAGTDRPAPARPLLRAGLYWPGATDATMARLRAEWTDGAPVVPVVFYRALLQGAGLNPVNRMTKALLRRGVNPMPVFVASLKDPVSQATLQTLLTDAPPDAILNLTSFAVGDPEANPLAAPWANAAPVFQAVLSGGTEAAWEAGTTGLSARDIAMNVALPEIDGRILSRVVGFKGEAYFDDATQCPIATWKAAGDRIAFVADLLANWCRLRRTAPADRRVALILANYPNRDGRLANGVGLDTPEATIHVLRLLRDAGYATEPPASSAALMAQLMAGPTNWLPDRADRRGGARLSLADYRAFYATLPSAARRQIEDRWGAPEEDPFLVADSGPTEASGPAPDAAPEDGPPSSVEAHLRQGPDDTPASDDTTLRRSGPRGSDASNHASRATLEADAFSPAGPRSSREAPDAGRPVEDYTPPRAERRRPDASILAIGAPPEGGTSSLADARPRAPSDASRAVEDVTLRPAESCTTETADPAAGGGSLRPEIRAPGAPAPAAIAATSTAAPGRAPQSGRDGHFALSIHRFGHVLVALQPARGYNVDPTGAYHSPDLVPPHNYLAFHAYLRREADALVHMGKHGNLEWLPGRATALGPDDWPEIALGPMPNVYPFIVNDPGEGTQAKRRAQAVIVDHLTPPLTRAESYGPMRDLEALVDEHYEAAGMDPRRVVLLRDEILSLARATGLDLDAGLGGAGSAGSAPGGIAPSGSDARGVGAAGRSNIASGGRDGAMPAGPASGNGDRSGAAPSAFGGPDDASDDLAKLDAYLCDLKEAQIRDGLHVFGRSPEGDLAHDLLQALLRLPRGDGGGPRAALPRAIAADLRLAFDPLDCDPALPWTGPRPDALASPRAEARPDAAAAETAVVEAAPSGIGAAHTPPPVGRIDLTPLNGTPAPGPLAGRPADAADPAPSGNTRPDLRRRPDAGRDDPLGDATPAARPTDTADSHGAGRTRHPTAPAHGGPLRDDAAAAPRAPDLTAATEARADARSSPADADQADTRPASGIDVTADPAAAVAAGQVLAAPARPGAARAAPAPDARTHGGRPRLTSGPADAGPEHDASLPVLHDRGPAPADPAPLGPWRSHGDTVERIEHLSAALLRGAAPSPGPATDAVLIEAATLRDAIAACGPAEGRALLTALDGRAIPPGPSGAPTRGRPDVLPTGRNFYSIDSRAVPTPTAWKLGWKSAGLLLDRHLQDHGDWPRALLVTAWGTANMRTGGDDIAQALALMGVRPVWDAANRRVTGFEILPADTLGRPRIDVTLRVSGFFRDAFPTQMALVDAAARAVQALDEPAACNPAAARARAGEGRSRVYGSKPGAYGAGLQAMIDERLWSETADLGASYVEWGGYAYGAGTDDGEGAPDHAGLRQRLAQAEAIVQNQDNREHDLLDSDDYYQFEGGAAAAVEMLRGARPPIYHNDHSRPERPVIRTLEEEIGRVVRSRVANPKWIAGVMRHGYKGAFEIAATIDYLFAFAATTGAVRDHHFDIVAAAILEDDAVRAFLGDANAPALADIADRLAEAVERRLWTPRSNAVRGLLAQHGRG